MTALRKIDDVTARIESETIALQLHLATRMMQRALLELRYAGQPRVPAGAPDGGQWTDGFGSGRATGRSEIRVAQGLGRQKFSGYLVERQYNAAKDQIYCIYHDSRQNYDFGVYRPGSYCPYAPLNF